MTRRRLAAVVLAAVTGAGSLNATGIAQAVPTPAVPPQAVPAQTGDDRAGPARPGAQRPDGDVDFTGIVALSNCSGSIVRGPRSRDGDAALVLTNGHCLETGMPPAGEVIVDRPSSRTFTLLDRTGRAELGSLRATRVEYATMTGTDVALYRLDASYADIARRYGVPALRLAASAPRDGTAIRVVSGYWKRIYACEVDATVPRLREAGWTWRDSIRYTPECRTVGGTSGSPIVDARTGTVVGVNNTGNEDGERCTLNNPCEVDDDGRVTVRHGINYGQQTHHLTRCLTEGGDVALHDGCGLPRP